MSGTTKGLEMIENVYIDWETFYGDKYTLRNHTLIEYLRDPQFEVIGVGVAVGDGEPVWYTGTLPELAYELKQLVDWKQACVVAHNCMFDAAILSWHLGITPHSYYCTMMGSRHTDIHRAKSMSLAKQAELYGLEKGNEVIAAKNMRLADFDPAALARYGKYCTTDVEICRELHHRQLEHINPIDRAMLSETVRKFVQPQLMLNYFRIEELIEEERIRRKRLLDRVAGFCTSAKPTNKGKIERDPVTAMLRSKKQFADALMHFGVQAPMKVSPTTGKEMYAQAKTDKEFMDLLNHPNDDVRTLVEAKLGIQTNLMTTRLQRLKKIAEINNAKLPFPLLWFGAHTGRFSGYDKINLQNLPSREGTSLRECVVPPLGHKIVAADLSQIEARITSVLAGCHRLTTAFVKGEDPYKLFAADLFGKAVRSIDTKERFIGKTAILGLQYQCGPERFRDMVLQANTGIEFTPAMAEHTVQTYRATFTEMRRLWRFAQGAIDMMWTLRNMTTSNRHEWLTVYRDRIELPGGRTLHFPELQKSDDGEFTYSNSKGVRVKIYGGKLVENIVQALAQLVVRDAEVRLCMGARLHAAGQAHDELIYVVRDSDLDDVLPKIEMAMTTQPIWAKRMGVELPLNCTIDVGSTYAETK